MKHRRLADSSRMCGRYALYGPKSRYRAAFNAELMDDINDTKIPFRFPLPADVAFWDIRPTTVQPVVLEDGGKRLLAMFRWGLIPFWAKELKGANTPFNARLDTAADKPSFKQAFRQRRCVVPVDAFYEWYAIPGQKAKQRYIIKPPDDASWGLAGLWDVWNGPEGPIPSFTIITTEPNELMATIHDRMPVILKAQNYAAWLDRELIEADQVRALCEPYPTELMQAEPFTPP